MLTAWVLASSGTGCCAKPPRSVAVLDHALTRPRLANTGSGSLARASVPTRPRRTGALVGVATGMLPLRPAPAVAEAAPSAAHAQSGAIASSNGQAARAEGVAAGLDGVRARVVGSKDASGLGRACHLSLVLLSPTYSTASVDGSVRASGRAIETAADAGIGVVADVEASTSSVYAIVAALIICKSSKRASVSSSSAAPSASRAARDPRRWALGGRFCCSGRPVLLTKDSLRPQNYASIRVRSYAGPRALVIGGVVGFATDSRSATTTPTSTNNGSDSRSPGASRVLGLPLMP